jgi:hypothetical protein
VVTATDRRARVGPREKSENMTDSKTHRSTPDRQLVSVEQRYEVSHLASKFGITIAEAEKAIRRHGPSRAAIEAALGDARGNAT